MRINEGMYQLFKPDLPALKIIFRLFLLLCVVFGLYCFLRPEPTPLQKIFANQPSARNLVDKSKQEVVRLLGQPENIREEGGKLVYYYSEPPRWFGHRFPMSLPYILSVEFEDDEKVSKAFVHD